MISSGWGSDAKSVLKGRRDMAIERIVHRLIEYAEGLYYRKWEWWELLALGLSGLLLLIMVVRSRTKATANEKHLRERTPDKRLQKFRDL